MVTQLQLNVQVRKEKGKEAVKKLRAKKLIPGIVYSKGTASIDIVLDQKEITHFLTKETSENIIIDLNIEGLKESKKVMIKEVQHDPVNDQLLHIDFHHISLKEEIEVEIPVVLVGEAKGMKEGGIIEQMIREIKIKCLPTEIPPHFEVNISNLIIGESIHLNDLKFTYKILTIGNPTIVSISPPVKEEVVSTLPEEKIEPDVIKEKKKTEEAVKNE